MLPLDLPTDITLNLQVVYISNLDPTYFPGRCADIYYNNILVGNFGIMNPSVLEKFEIGYPTSCLEMNIEYFL